MRCQTNVESLSPPGCQPWCSRLGWSHLRWLALAMLKVGVGTPKSLQFSSSRSLDFQSRTHAARGAGVGASQRATTAMMEGRARRSNANSPALLLVLIFKPSLRISRPVPNLGMMPIKLREVIILTTDYLLLHHHTTYYYIATSQDPIAYYSRTLSFSPQARSVPAEKLLIQR